MSVVLGGERTLYEYSIAGDCSILTRVGRVILLRGVEYD